MGKHIADSQVDIHRQAYDDPNKPRHRMEVDAHICHFCGEWLIMPGVDHKGKRHWLSDCRPDLVEHAVGELCTWPQYINSSNRASCYGYYQEETKTWTLRHEYFDEDGPM